MATAAAAGVTAAIEPGGSVRDDEVIAIADAAGMALVFTGERHFRHSKPFAPPPTPFKVCPGPPFIFISPNKKKVVAGRSVRTLHLFLTENLHHEWRIVIADNGSRDGTLAIAKRLAKELENVDWLHVPEAGRGRALTRAWLASEADVLAYMDIDLSTDLGGVPAARQRGRRPGLRRRGRHAAGPRPRRRGR